MIKNTPGYGGMLLFDVKTWAKVGLAALIGAMTVRLLRWTGTAGGRVEEIASGTSNLPMAQGKKSNPQIAQLLDEYGRYLTDQGVNINWFPPEKLTRLRRWGVYAIPPRHRWDEMAFTIINVVQPLRKKYGAVKIKNAYRPRDYNESASGAKNSRHIWNQAMDFELEDASMAQRRQAGLELARLYKSEEGKELKLGLGIYSAPTPRTFHVDTGHKRRHWKKTKTYLAQV